MIFNIAYFVTLFQEYNTKYFNNQVKQMNVHTYQRRSRILGRFAGHRGIYINTSRQREENEYKETLLHEMVHAWLWSIGQRFGHTPVFKSKMRQIFTKEFGFISQNNPRFVMGTKKLNPFTAPGVVFAPASFVPSSKVVPVSDLIPANIIKTAGLPGFKINPQPAPVMPLNGATLPFNGLKFKVLSNGRIGDFVAERMVYGKKHLVLKIEGNLFNFVTPIENTVPVK